MLGAEGLKFRAVRSLELQLQADGCSTIDGDGRPEKDRRTNAVCATDSSASCSSSRSHSLRCSSSRSRSAWAMQESQAVIAHGPPADGRLGHLNSRLALLSFLRTQRNALTQLQRTG